MILSIINQKGGVGKSTTAINLSAGLALQGYKVLLLDLDAQANITNVFIHEKKELPVDQTLYHVLINFFPLKHIIKPTQTDNLFIAPAHIRLSSVDLELAQAFDNRSERLKKAIETAKDHYDHLIIDTPPSLGLLTINALAASDYLLIPVSTGYFALTGLVQLQETISMVKQTQLNPSLNILGVLCTFVEHTRVSRDVEAQLREYLSDLVFSTTIPKNVSLEEAHSRHMDIFRYAPNSKGAQAYHALAKEVISR